MESIILYYCEILWKFKIENTTVDSYSNHFHGNWESVMLLTSHIEKKKKKASSGMYRNVVTARSHVQSEVDYI